jgi:hypothetical protein
MERCGVYFSYAYRARPPEEPVPYLQRAGAHRVDRAVQDVRDIPAHESAHDDPEEPDDGHVSRAEIVPREHGHGDPHEIRHQPRRERRGEGVPDAEPAPREHHRDAVERDRPAPRRRDGGLAPDGRWALPGAVREDRYGKLPVAGLAARDVAVTQCRGAKRRARGDGRRGQAASRVRSENR